MTSTSFYPPSKSNHLIGILTAFTPRRWATDFGNILTDAGKNRHICLFIGSNPIVILVTYLTIIFGEQFAQTHWHECLHQTAKLLASHVLAVRHSLSFVWILCQKATSLFFNLLHINTAEEKVTEEEIKSMIDEGTENGEVQEVEQDIVDESSPWATVASTPS